jgi:hypothetical protein
VRQATGYVDDGGQRIRSQPFEQQSAVLGQAQGQVLDVGTLDVDAVPVIRKYSSASPVELGAP